MTNEIYEKIKKEAELKYPFIKNDGNKYFAMENTERAELIKTYMLGVVRGYNAAVEQQSIKSSH